MSSKPPKTKSLEITFPPKWENEVIDQILFYVHMVEIGFDGMGGIYPTNGFESFRIAYRDKELPPVVEDFLESMKSVYGLKCEKVKK